MIDFISAVKNILEEQDKTTDNLFEDKVVSSNTFYKYKQRNPSLTTLIRIANYLKVSIDYLLELSVENNYKEYNLDNLHFYDNLLNLLKSRNLSGRQFCKEMNYSRDNLIRWKNNTSPNLATLIEISNYFNCTINDLICE